MNCPNCKATAEKDSEFCKTCGTKFSKCEICGELTEIGKKLCDRCEKEQLKMKQIKNARIIKKEIERQREIQLKQDLEDMKKYEEEINADMRFEKEEIQKKDTDRTKKVKQTGRNGIFIFLTIIFLIGSIIFINRTLKVETEIKRIENENILLKKKIEDEKNSPEKISKENEKEGSNIEKSLFSSGVRPLGKLEGQNVKYAYVNSDFKNLTGYEYDFTGEMSEGRIKVSKGGKFGFLDENYKVAVPMKYTYADNFSEGFATVGIGKKFGFIDKSGKQILIPSYEEAYSFSEKVAVIGVVKPDGKKWYGAINTSGKQIIPVKYEQISRCKEGRIAFKDAGKWGYMDNFGKIVIPAVYDEAKNFSNGFAAVKKDGKFAYIDKDNNKKTKFIFDEAFDFGQKIAKVKIDSKFAIIDKEANFLLDPEYDCIDFKNDGKFKVSKNSKFGITDLDKNIILELKYEDVGDISDQYFAVREGGKWGILDKDKNFVVEPSYDYISIFVNGYAKMGIIKDSKIKYGFVDKNARRIIEPSYDKVTDFYGKKAYAGVKYNQKDFMLFEIDTSGRQKFSPFEYFAKDFEFDLQD